MTIFYANGSQTASLSTADLRDALEQTFRARGLPEKALLLPPDATRLFSRAGEITVLCHELLGDAVADIMPALGTHSPMKPEQLDHMFPGIPHDLIRPHRWRDDVVTLGTVPASYVCEVTGGLYDRPWQAQVNQLLRDGGHDLIFSIGQVVPHEVIGMANYNKNVFVGTGGAEGINESHYLSAVYGIEQTLGRADTPLRKILNYAQDHFCQDLPLLYALTVVQQMADGTLHTRGLYIGDDHDTFFQAAELAREVNITHLGSRAAACRGVLGSARIQEHLAGQQSGVSNKIGGRDRRPVDGPWPGRRRVRRRPGNRPHDSQVRLPDQSRDHAVGRGQRRSGSESFGGGTSGSRLA